MKLAAFAFGAIPLLIQMYSQKYKEEDLEKTLTELEDDFGIPRIKTFDFIIVGGGSAGCVIAGRLSEHFNVLLIEAGGEPVPQTTVPFFMREVGVAEGINYLYKSVPQKNMSLAFGGLVGLEMGKMMGGSGSHNDMLHQRGNPRDWDLYAEITNDPSWSYSSILEFFKKSETYKGELLQPEQSEYYGTSGPLTIERQNLAIFPKWAEAAAELGYIVADPNAQQVPSFAPFDKLIHDGRRVSTYNQYVLPFESSRANLTVVRYSVVTQILFDGENRAYGVSYLRHGIPQIAHASKEIIISAGAVNSPIVLMLSGIGSRDVLESANIPVKVNLPNVGKNMVDHIWLGVTNFRFNASAEPFLPRIREANLETAITEYLEAGSGEIGETQEGPQAFIVSSRATAEGETGWPDARVILDLSCPQAIDDSVESTACFFLELDRAKSRGSVGLNVSAYLAGSTDFIELALLDFNGFSVGSDMDVMLESVDLAFKIIEETNAFKSIGAYYAEGPVQGCQQFPFRSREYWSCYTQQFATTAIHLVGTCAMGNSSSTIAVTDSKLKVRGVTGLRVVDASVLPMTPNANLNGPVIALAEKASADILSDWNVKCDVGCNTASKSTFVTSWTVVLFVFTFVNSIY